MLLHRMEHQDFLFVDKPAGISTHGVEKGQLGLVELYSQELNAPLFVSHRLDKTTSGAMVFARTPKAAEYLRVIFENHQAEKTYWFVTDRSSGDRSEEKVRSLISKKGNHFVSEFSESLHQRNSDNTAQLNSETHFKRLKRSPFFELWEAKPTTGKSHQIRLHASDIGLPLLGDVLYGGTPFPHLCLHALELRLPDLEPWTCPAPRFFERLGVLRDPELVRILSGIDRRQRLYDFLKQPQQCLRLAHLESPSVTIDLLGEQLSIQWYSPTPPQIKDLQRLEFIQNLLRRPFHLRTMENRGKDPNSKSTWISEPPPKESWVAQEGSQKFLLKTNKGQSYGLFLDQRNARAWLRKNSPKKVLNLFSYTCGFSVSAALGGAQEVVSVDVSRDYLNWGKENFTLNGIDPEKFEFFSQDVLLFLKACEKRNRRFDLVICDPPLFGRHKEGIFKLDRDLKELLQRCQKVLHPGGLALFSCHHEGLSQKEFVALVKENGPWKTVSPPFSRGLDFEWPEEEPQLKQVLVQL